MASIYKRKKQNQIINIIIVVIIVLLILARLASINKRKAEIDNVSILDRTNEENEELETDNITKMLQNMEERDRMEYYFSMFLGYIEDSKYDKAYDLLYPEFRENYFPDIDSFIEYVNQTFTEMSDIEHTNIERNGEVYVLWIEISDAINGKPGEKKEMNIVIQENNYNDFCLSFSVI